MINAAVTVIETERQHTAQLAAEGLHPWTRFVRDGSLDALAREAAWIQQTMEWWAG